MNARTILLFLAGAAAAAVLVFALRNQASEAAPVHAVNTETGHARVTHIVEKTLHEHEGEESPIVAAFAEALAPG